MDVTGISTNAGQSSGTITSGGDMPLPAVSIFNR